MSEKYPNKLPTEVTKNVPNFFERHAPHSLAELSNYVLSGALLYVAHDTPDHNTGVKLCLLAAVSLMSGIASHNAHER